MDALMDDLPGLLAILMLTAFFVLCAAVNVEKRKRMNARERYMEDQRDMLNLLAMEEHQRRMAYDVSNVSGLGFWDQPHHTVPPGWSDPGFPSPTCPNPAWSDPGQTCQAQTTWCDPGQQTNNNQPCDIPPQF